MAYATVEELARVLTLAPPSAAQTEALDRVLETSAGEIDNYIGATAVAALAGWQLDLVAEVNLERAVEHWKQGQSPFGVIGLGDTVPMMTAKDTWDRHAHKLAPLKSQWPIG